MSVACDWIRENQEDLIKLNLALACLVPATILGWYLGQRALPWWSDGGNWLKHMNALLGNSWPMWDEGPFQYPPLYFILLAPLVAVLGDQWALKLVAIVIFSSMPLPTYLLTSRLFRSRLAGVASAWLVAIPPALVEMIGWGGYPNLLGLILMVAAFYFVYQSSETLQASDLAKASVLVLLVMLSHHLTYLVTMGTLGLWAVLLGLMRDWKRTRAVVVVSLVGLLGFVAYRLILAWPIQFILSNEQAYYALAPNPGVIQWLFKDSNLFLLLYLVASCSALFCVVTRRHIAAATLVISWAAAPILICFGHVLGIAIDYMRIIAFEVQPLAVLCAFPLTFVTYESITDMASPAGSTSYVDGAVAKLESLIRHVTRPSTIAKMILVIGAVSSVALMVPIGVRTVESVNSWYNGVDPYGDGAKVELADWIAANTYKEDVFVAQEQIARWIEGLGQRRVLMHQQPMYLFMTGELEREMAAKAILTSQRGMMNGEVWVADQSPFGTMAPLISFYHEGWYSDILFLDADRSSILTRMPDGSTLNETLLEATRVDVSWVRKDTQQAILRAAYTLPHVIVSRDIVLNEGEKKVRIDFLARPVGDVSVLALSVHFGYDAIGVQVWGVYLQSERTLRLATNRGEICMSADADQAFPFVFKTSGGRNVVTGNITIYSDEPGHADLGLVSYERDDYVNAYNVKYIVVPKELVGSQLDFVSIKTNTNVLYRHLLEDESLQLVYENTQLIVLKETDGAHSTKMGATPLAGASTVGRGVGS